MYVRPIFLGIKSLIKLKWCISRLDVINDMGFAYLEWSMAFISCLRGEDGTQLSIKHCLYHFLYVLPCDVSDQLHPTRNCLYDSSVDKYSDMFR
jgi:hypothetical protein